MELSITKGCFLSKPQGKKPKKILCNVSFNKLPGETCKDSNIRQKAYKRCWETIESKLEAITDTTRQNVLKEFDEFFDESILNVCGYSSGHAQTRREIPTALVYEYGCSSSGSNLLSVIEDDLRESEVSPVLIRLTMSSTIGTNMKSLMKAIMLQLLQWDEDSDTEEGPSMRLPDCSMSTLCGWYTEHSSSDENKEKSPPVCILIDSFESFPIHLFQDLIEVLSSRINEFPVIFLLGFQLPMNLHPLLSSSTLVKLNITQLHYTPTEDIMRTLLENMLFDPSIPVKISPECCELLLDNFKYTNPSLVSCVGQIKSIVLDHFYWHPLSHVSVISPDKLIQSLSDNQCEMIRATPSIMSLAERRQPDEINELLTDNKTLKEQISQFLTAIEAYHRSILPLIQSLLSFAIGRDGKKLSRHKIDVAIEVYKASTPLDVVGPILEYFSVSSTDVFRDCLSECLECLNKYKKTIARRQRPQWLVSLLEQLEIYDAELEDLMKSDVIDTRAVKRVKATASKYIKQLYCDQLPSIKSMPLHEIFYYTNTNKLLKQIQVSPRQSVLRALNTPQYYLKSPDCCSSDGNIPIPYPSVAYQQYQSMNSRVIQLSDWMEACCVTETHSQSEQEQAGFLQAIAEMQFIGLHKSLPQKAGSVVKLL